MRTQSVTLGAVGSSAWLPMDYNVVPFNVGIGVTLTPSASLTFTVQHTHDDPFLKSDQTVITRVTTTVTVKKIAHGLSIADFVHVEGANKATGDVFDGDFAVAAITDADNFTYTVANTGSTSGYADARVTTLRVRPHASLAAATASADGNYAFPIRAIRLNVSVHSSGKASMVINQGT